MVKTFIIAEAGVNHNGSLKEALALVDAAAEAGACAIKFQTFRASRMVTGTAAKAAYQTQFTDARESQLAMLERLEIGEAEHKALVKQCLERKIEFISSPFDLQSVDLLVNCSARTIKIPSGEVTNGPLLWKIATTGLPSILSTGMATLGEIESALGVLAHGYANPGLTLKNPDFLKQIRNCDLDILKEKVMLMQCTSMYPAAFDDINLKCMDTLKTAFGLRVGLSDHSVGIEVPIAAAALGAAAIEKHFTLSRNQEGPDHQASIEPAELKSMVEMIRNVERAIGSPRKYPVDDEFDTRSVARRGVVAGCNIAKGMLLTEENLVVKRPELGMSPMSYWKLLGQRASKDYTEDETISERLD